MWSAGPPPPHGNRQGSEQQDCDTSQGRMGPRGPWRDGDVGGGFWLCLAKSYDLCEANGCCATPLGPRLHARTLGTPSPAPHPSTGGCGHRPNRGDNLHPHRTPPQTTQTHLVEPPRYRSFPLLIGRLSRGLGEKGWRVTRAATPPRPQAPGLHALPRRRRPATPRR